MSGLQVLIRRWQAGDERAAEAIYNRFWDTSLGLDYSLLDDLADAEEAAQDALTYALTHIERYDPTRARFSTWLYTITVSPLPGPASAPDSAQPAPVRVVKRRRRRPRPGPEPGAARHPGNDAG